MKDCRYYDMCFRCGDECNGEPECPHRRTCQFYSPMPDRDALLALAEVLHDMGNQYDAHNRYELGTTFRSIADRIREALVVA